MRARGFRAAHAEHLASMAPAGVGASMANTVNANASAEAAETATVDRRDGTTMVVDGCAKNAKESEEPQKAFAFEEMRRGLAPARGARP